MILNENYLMNNFTHKVQGISIVDKDSFHTMLKPIFKYYDNDFNNDLDLKNELKKSIRLRHMYLDISKMYSLKHSIDQSIQHESYLFQFDPYDSHSIELDNIMNFCYVNEINLPIKIHDIVNHNHFDILFCDYVFKDIEKEMHSFIRKLFNYNESEELYEKFHYPMFISKGSYSYKNFLRNDKIKVLLVDKEHLINDLYDSTVNRSIFNSIPEGHYDFKERVTHNCIGKLLLNLKTDDNKFIFDRNSYINDYGNYLSFIEDDFEMQKNYCLLKCAMIKNIQDIINSIDEMNEIHIDINIKNPFNKIKDPMICYLYHLKNFA